MSNPSKQKGTAFETAVVRYLHYRNHPFVERRALAGNTDRGDVSGIHNVVLEAKCCAKFDLAGWTREARTEADNASADIGVVVAKKRGTTDVGQAYAVLPFAQLVTLLEEAGRL